MASPKTTVARRRCHWGQRTAFSYAFVSVPNSSIVVKLKVYIALETLGLEDPTLFS